ncbi:cloacin [Salmonella enterica subsp. enterica serovar Cairina]|nr:cloacin [Salmonella enterica subsp. enterica serovar Cairina]EAM8676628.1 cloacin [Salmonella enterica]EDT2939711.1 cloacin [Salmonella enterica subsp. enterica]EHQ0126784.1 cloacin [Salmonella enterica subsp. enterica serovar Elisabethville]EBR4550570.1 cloacin [Salmonella enterica]
MGSINHDCPRFFYAFQQGGGDKRARWYGDKRRKIYEWDSQYGELEGDPASDGEHPGAFDPKTGKQVKAPDSKRILAILSIPFFTDVFNQNFP